ncbi:MAG TPA: LacI family DNA-binding transcriptional regulator [Trebonia sp.]
MSDRADEAPGARRRPVTIAEVAAAAKVSVSTAARVLRGDDAKVDRLMASRVRREAAKLHYVPNALARSLRGAGPLTVGLIVGDMLDPYYGTIAESVTEAAESEHSMVAIVSNMQRDPALELRQARQLWSHRVAGLILAGGSFDQHRLQEEFNATVAEIQRSGTLVVSLSPRQVPDLPTFSVDAIKTGELMAARLLDAGLTRIGVMSGPLLSEATRGRVEGARNFLEPRGAHVLAHSGDYTPESSRRLTVQLLDDMPDLEGIVVATDAMAIEVVGELRRRGLKVPDDVSVVSAGNTRLAGYASPQLTSVDVRLSEAGRAALNYIAANVGATRPVEPQALGEPFLVERQSARPIAS